MNKLIGAGRGGRTPMTLRSADFESAASASSTIPAHGADRVILHGFSQENLPFSPASEKWRPSVELLLHPVAKPAFQTLPCCAPVSDERDFVHLGC